MKIAIASDHAGYRLKTVVAEWLSENGHEVLDLGTDSEESVDYPGFCAYMDDMYASGDLFVTPQARQLSIDIVMRPPVPVWAKGLLELVNQITVGLLPADIRRQYGFSWDPARAVALHGGA